MKQTSGLEALLEALKQSGMNINGEDFGRGASSPIDAEAQDTSSTRGGRGSRGDSAGDGSSGRGRRRDAGSSTRGGKTGDDSGSSTNIPHIEFPFADRMRAWSTRAIIIAIVVLVIVLLCAYWWFHPPINIHSIDTWSFIVIFVLLPLFLVFRVKSKTYAEGSAKKPASPTRSKMFKWLSFVPVVVLVIGIGGGIMSLSIIPGNASRYANILQTTNLDFTQDIQEVNYSEIPVIDRDSAALLGNREMGSIPEYVSQFEISSLYSQINYQGEPVRVSPLGYADLFKWFTNRGSGIPAYVLVNMTTQDAEIVKLEDGAIYYSQSEPLARNIDRYVQLKYPFYMFDEKSFEIDEDGHPWWICPVQTRTIGLFGGTTISRVVLCDATTGECQDLAIDEVPEWVDRVYPASLLIEQYNWSGKYKNGWLNSFLGQEGVVQTTPGTDGDLGYNYIAKDDDVWVYTGVTSATADNSIVGFVLINQRTAESHYYSVPGATEESAMGSAEGQVQNLRYTATFPLLINVANQPTYFMALKDSEGLVKKFAMIDIQHYQNVAVGDTVADCQKAYLSLLATNGVTAGNESSTAIETSGVITNMAQAVVESNSHFYVMIDGDDNIYDFALPSLIGIVKYQQGDTIHFTYLEGETTNPVESIIENDADKTEDAKAEGVTTDDKGETADKAANTADASETNADTTADASAGTATTQDTNAKTV